MNAIRKYQLFIDGQWRDPQSGQWIDSVNPYKYGLAAGVWTGNIRRVITMAERLEAETVWVNTYRSTGYSTPFGG